MAKQISEGDYATLTKQLKLSQAQLDALDQAYKKAEGSISKP